MLARSLLLVLLLIALGIGAAGWTEAWRAGRPAQTSDFTRRRLDFLEAENARLHGLLDAQQRAAELAATAESRSQIERTVAELRSLPFLQRVTYRQIPRSQLPDILRQKLAQQVPDQELGNDAVGLAALGLLPRGLDLKKTYLALLGEQVGAFYDQSSQELFTFSGQSLGNSQNRVILAHELTHALEDQHFHLGRLPLEAKGNDDRALAASALVEGDATLVMNRYMTNNLSAAVLRDSLAGALTTDVRQLAAAPRYLRETLLFPYLHGLEFCQALYDQGGWDALAGAFEHPPASSSEILHPEQFFARPRPEPVAVAFADAPVLGQTPTDDNVLGEFGTRELLFLWLKDLPQAESAAKGWRGDRYRVYGDAAADSYVWRTAWADPPSAERFADALKRCLSNRYKDLPPPHGTTPSEDFTLGSADAKGGRMLRLYRLGPAELVLIDAQDARWFSALQSCYAAPKDGP